MNQIIPQPTAISSPKTPLFEDSSAEAEAFLLHLLRNSSAARKLAMVGQMNQSVKMLALAGLRERHPKANKATLRRLLADILLGSEVAARVYGALEPTSES